MNRNSWKDFAAEPGDDQDTRSEKISILIVATACCCAGVVWGLTYYLIFGLTITTLLPFVFVVGVGSALVVSHYLRNHRIAIYAQIVCIMYVTAFIQWTMGGMIDSGFVIVWSLLGPLIALMFFSLRNSLFWLGAFLVNIAITAVFDDTFSAHRLDVGPELQRYFFVMNTAVSAVVIFTFATYFVHSAQAEKSRANNLLLNVLPKAIADRLKLHSDVIAEEFPDVSVLFADIVEYTEFSSRQTPVQLVTTLNQVFQAFDALTERHRLEKIKTIGDAYMVVGGLPEPCAGHDSAVARMALDMLAAIKQVEKDGGGPFMIRIGMHAGPVVAGVIGKSKFTYDLWGDTVNVASRLEASSEPDKIHASEAIYQRLNGHFRFSRRAPVSIKGKGNMQTYFLEGEAAH